MIKYYLVLFLRNLQRQKLFSFINLLGLSISIVSTLVIYLYVGHELSYDRFHLHADRIYRVNQTFIWGERPDHQFGSTGPGVAHAIKEELSEVELVSSLFMPGNQILTYTTPQSDVISFEEDKLLAGDTNFFKMFNFPFLKGNPETALRNAQTIVLTESLALKYFGDEDPMGKLITIGVKDDQKTFEVTGIVKDTPANSYIEFSAMLSIETYPIRRMHWSWIWTQLETYVRLNENADIAIVRSRLAGIPRKHAEETLRRTMNITYDEYIKSGKKWELFLQPLTSIHLPTSVVYNRINPPGDIKIVYALAGAGIFVVILSCINFMNLSTAQFTKRLKEASVRKILGLGRFQLSLNYFIEAMIFCSLALIIGLALTQLFLPSFNTISGKDIQLNFLGDIKLQLSLGGLILLMALFSGGYPAIFLSSFHPVEALKGKLKTGAQGRAFRNGLVVFQFSASIVLIICTGIVYSQLNFVMNKNLGFEKENLLVLKHVENVSDPESLANAALAMPGVESATFCSSLPPNVFGGDSFSAEGMNNKVFPLNYNSSDENYIPTLGIRMKFGRNFSKEFPEDQNRVILNETAVKRIGWDVNESVIGRKITSPGGEVQWEVVGIVEDFNFWSLQAAMEPMAIFNIKNKELDGAGSKRYIALRIAAQDATSWETTFSEVDKLWRVHAGAIPLDHYFVDEEFARTFGSQQQFGKALTVMAGLAILIASLGLLGMIVYSLENRIKEIGIRKVSGASTWNILTMISRGYTALIVISFVIGAPLAYWMMQGWLSDFAYRVTPSPWLFISVGGGILLISILVTGYHSMKAAMTNPAEVLKDE